MEQLSPVLQAKIFQQQLNQTNNYTTQPKFNITGTKLEQLDKDVVTLSSNNNGSFDYSIDDGKISFGDKLKNFGKGLLSPITGMFSSPKNFLIGAVMIAGGVALNIATAGAVAPLFVALGLTGGAIQLGTSIVKSHNATTDDEARSAWQGMGAGTSAIGMSVLGSKAALKGAGVDTKGMNFIQATAECFRQVPSSVSKSVGAFTSGQAVTNMQNAFKAHKTTNNESLKQEEFESTQEQNHQNKQQAESKINQQTESKTEIKVSTETNAEPKIETKALSETNAEPKTETKTLSETIVEPQTETKPLTPEQIQKMKEIEFKKNQEFANDFVKSHYDELESIFTDENGKLTNPYEFADKTPLDINEYTGSDKIYHATTNEAKQAILNEGFRQDIAPKHGYRDGIGGVYFSTDKPQPGAYGDAIIEAQFQGKIASVDTNILNEIKNGGADVISSRYNTDLSLSNSIAEKFLQNWFLKKEFSGIMGSNFSYRAACQYFAALDPNLIKILS